MDLKALCRLFDQEYFYGCVCVCVSGPSGVVHREDRQATQDPDSEHQEAGQVHRLAAS